MLCYVDSNIVICAAEGQPAFRQRARNHIAALEIAGHRFAVSDLILAECLVWPYRNGDGDLLMLYEMFFLGPYLTTVHLTPAAHRRAARIRAIHSYGLADSLHLAVAVENRLDRFLTNDNRLAGFPDITVEVLP